MCGDLNIITAMPFLNSIASPAAVTPVGKGAVDIFIFRSDAITYSRLARLFLIDLILMK